MSYEIWRHVARFDGYGHEVQVSSWGGLRKRPINTEDWSYPTQQRNKDGYYLVNLYFRPSPYRWTGVVHRLVAEAFVPNPDNHPCTNHKDMDKRNNAIANLEWCTVKYNTAHARALLPDYAAHGEQSGHAKLVEQEVLEIHELLLEGTHCIDIANKYHVDRKTISDIKLGLTWKHLNLPVIRTRRRTPNGR